MAKRICSVHDLPLIRDRVPIRYGLPFAPPEGHFEAQRELFPNSNTFVLGGCMISDKAFEPVYYCPSCRSAEEEWQSTREVDGSWRV